MTVQEELEAIREEHDGLLRAEDVVEYAQNPETSLHKKFLWDDSAAAHQYRLSQARSVIRVFVITPETTLLSVRAYVSLMSDRKQLGGGYRRLDDVMANIDMRRQLLAQALKEARVWQQKFRQLDELQPVFDAINRTPTASGIVTAQAGNLELVA